MSIRVICFSNQKGGVAKTTSAINLGFSLINRGYRVCFLDMDLQGNMTVGLGHDDMDVLGIFEVLTDKYTISEVWQDIPNTSSKLIPGNAKLEFLKDALKDKEDVDFLLKNKLRPLERSFDFIIIDTAPHFFLPTIMAICACDCVLVPVHAGYFSLKGVIKLERRLSMIDKNISALFLTQYDGRRGTDKEAYKSLKNFYRDKFFLTPIRFNIALNNSQSYGLDVFSFDSKSNGAKDYTSLTQEFLKSIGELDG